MKDKSRDILRKATNLRSLDARSVRRRDSVAAGDIDLYKFRLSERASSRIRLKGLKNKANADIELFELKGRDRRVLRSIGNVPIGDLTRREYRKNIKRLGRSRRKRSKNESIRRLLGAGTYYIQVSQRKGSSPYRLLASAKPTRPTDDVTSPPVFARQWIRQLPSDNPNRVTAANNTPGAVAVDLFGNTYISGYSSSPVAGGPQGSFFDAWFAKYSATGDRLWVRHIATGSNDYINGLVTDGQGNVYLAGGTSRDTGPGAAAFIAKYNTNGSELWTSKIVTSTPGDLPVANDIAIDPSGNLVITGRAFGSVDGVIDEGSFDAFVAKYSASNGVQQWARQLGTSGFDDGLVVDTDSAGNVYVAGDTPGALGGNFIGGSKDVWLAKYDGTGNRQWVRQFGTSSTETVAGIAVDAQGSVYVTGDTAGANGELWTQNSPWLVRYSGGGTRLFSAQYGTNLTEPIDLEISSDGRLYSVGRTQDAFQGILGGAWNAYIVELDGLARVVSSQILRTSSEDRATAIAISSMNALHVVGLTGGSLGRTNPRSPVWDVWVAKYSST